MKLKKYLFLPMVAAFVWTVTSCDSDSDTVSTGKGKPNPVPEAVLPAPFEAGDFVAINGLSTNINVNLNIFSETFLNMTVGAHSRNLSYNYDKEGENFASLIVSIDNDNFDEDTEETPNFAYTPAQFTTLTSDSTVTANLVAIADVLNTLYTNYFFSVSGDGELFLVQSVSIDFDDQLGSTLTFAGPEVTYSTTAMDAMANTIAMNFVRDMIVIPDLEDRVRHTNTFEQATVIVTQ